MYTKNPKDLKFFSDDYINHISDKLKIKNKFDAFSNNPKKSHLIVVCTISEGTPKLLGQTIIPTSSLDVVKKCAINMKNNYNKKLDNILVEIYDLKDYTSPKISFLGGIFEKSLNNPLDIFTKSNTQLFISEAKEIIDELTLIPKFITEDNVFIEYSQKNKDIIQELEESFTSKVKYPLQEFSQTDVDLFASKLKQNLQEMRTTSSIYTNTEIELLNLNSLQFKWEIIS